MQLTNEWRAKESASVKTYLILNIVVCFPLGISACDRKGPINENNRYCWLSTVESTLCCSQIECLLFMHVFAVRSLAKPYPTIPTSVSVTSGALRCSLVANLTTFLQGRDTDVK